jgi:hypothetical protein
MSCAIVEHGTQTTGAAETSTARPGRSSLEERRATMRRPLDVVRGGWATGVLVIGRDALRWSFEAPNASDMRYR